jgi:hypothetical protein
MRRHRQRMHARIGPPGRVERRLSPGDRDTGLLDRLLTTGRAPAAASP